MTEIELILLSCHPSSVIRLLNLSSEICPLSFDICHPSSDLCHLTSVLCHP